jgi:hypothetical protein
MQEHALCFPERLRLNEVDSVFRFVPFAFIRIELEFHAVDLTKAPASPASHAASTSVHALHPNVARSPIMHHNLLRPAIAGPLRIWERLMMQEAKL